MGKWAVLVFETGLNMPGLFNDITGKTKPPHPDYMITVFWILCINEKRYQVL